MREISDFPGFRILPALMIVAAICFGLRFSEFMSSSSSHSSSRSAAALSANDFAGIEPASGAASPETSAPGAAGETGKTEDAKKADEVKPAEAKPADEKAEAAKPEAAPGKPTIEAPTLGSAPQKEDWKGADDLDDEYSDVKLELFEDLSKRRKDLEAKEKELAMREALLKAAQSELEQKTTELTTIKTDIETLLKKQTEQEDERIASLVKIYEGMKAKDAARIFNTLEMDVLLQVITKMSERKSAPIIAAMDATKARNITLMLAEQNKLPNLPTLQ